MHGKRFVRKTFDVKFVSFFNTHILKVRRKNNSKHIRNYIIPLQNYMLHNYYKYFDLDECLVNSYIILGIMIILYKYKLYLNG